MYNQNTLNFNRSIGEIHMATPAAVAIGVAGTYVKAGGTTTLDTAVNFDSPITNRLRCLNKPGAKNYLLNCSGSMSTTAANNSMAIRIYINGIADTSSTIQTRSETGGQPVAFATTIIPNLTLNDYVEVWVTNITATNAVTVTNLTITITEL